MVYDVTLFFFSVLHLIQHVDSVSVSGTKGVFERTRNGWRKRQTHRLDGFHINNN